MDQVKEKYLSTTRAREIKLNLTLNLEAKPRNVLNLEIFDDGCILTYGTLTLCGEGLRPLAALMMCPTV